VNLVVVTGKGSELLCNYKKTNERPFTIGNIDVEIIEGVLQLIVEEEVQLDILQGAKENGSKVDDIRWVVFVGDG
jgi:hypothetical protein